MKKYLIICMLAAFVGLGGCGENVDSSNNTSTSTKLPNLIKSFYDEDRPSGSLMNPFSTEGTDGWEPNEKILFEPPALFVKNGNLSLEVKPYSVNWAYALSDVEWTTVKSEEPVHPIDQKYEEYLMTRDVEVANLSLKFDMDFDGITMIHRYRLSDENLAYSGDSASLVEKIGHLIDYDDYEEIAVPEELTNPCVIEVSDDGDFIYDITVVWDHECFRGSASYSFRVNKE